MDIGWFWISRYLDHFIFVGQVLRQYAPPGCSVDIPKLGPSSQFYKSQKYLSKKVASACVSTYCKNLVPILSESVPIAVIYSTLSLSQDYPSSQCYSVSKYIILCEMKKSVFLRPVSERFIPFSSKLSTL